MEFNCLALYLMVVFTYITGKHVLFFGFISRAVSRIYGSVFNMRVDGNAYNF